MRLPNKKGGLEYRDDIYPEIYPIIINGENIVNIEAIVYTMT